MPSARKVLDEIFAGLRANAASGGPGWHETDTATPRPLTEEEVDGWFEAADSRTPPTLEHLQSFTNNLARQRPILGKLAQAALWWVLYEARRQNVRWRR